jgi:arginine N-succinyltransferase
VHASQELKVSNRIRSLHLCHDLTGHTLLTSFYIAPAYAHSEWPQLLSRARLLFINEFPRRFADRLAAEIPGRVDAHGHSPFWEAVGKRFFNMEYPQADRLSGGRSKTFIAELMPQYPIYVPLLPPDAQQTIGRASDNGELPMSILRDEGFETDTYVDIFDAGPTVDARLRTLRTVQTSKRLQIGAAAISGPTAQLCIIATTECASFRATIGMATRRRIETGDEILLSQDVIDAIGRKRGDWVCVAPLAGSWSMAA